MEGITLIVNGLDVSSRLSTYQAPMEVAYARVITTLDDVEHPYPGAKRPLLRFSLLPMTDEESQSVYWAMRDLVFPVTFTNPRGGEETRAFRLVSDLESAFLLVSPDGKRRWRGGTLELRAI